MPTIKHLAIITHGYPSEAHPAQLPFVRQFAHAVARRGVQTTVIHPVAFHRALSRRNLPAASLDVMRETSVHVLRPRFVSLSSRDWFVTLGSFNPARLTLRNFIAAARRAAQSLAGPQDCFYGHFLYPSGVAAIVLGHEYGVLALPGAGESVKKGGTIWSIRCYGIDHAREHIQSASGIIVNSSLLKSIITDQLEVPSCMIGVFPNGVDMSRFKPLDKTASRKELGFPKDKFIIACVGAFSHRKGQSRVLAAVKDAEGIAVAFAGSGVFFPLGPNVVCNTPFPQEQIPRVLSACDAFVLPTLEEGSCNAIVEAMACGLPIISSNGMFNDDLLTESMSIRVDPVDVSAIRRAIMELRDNVKRRERMGRVALLHAQKYDINDRARRILEFMECARGSGIPNTDQMRWSATP